MVTRTGLCGKKFLERSEIEKVIKTLDFKKSLQKAYELHRVDNKLRTEIQLELTNGRISYENYQKGEYAQGSWIVLYSMEGDLLQDFNYAKDGLSDASDEKINNAIVYKILGNERQKIDENITEQLNEAYRDDMEAWNNIEKGR